MPNYLAKKVRPDVFVISSSTHDFENYEEKMREEHKDFCKKIICLEPQAETSTSAKIAKIVQTGNIEAFKELYDEMGALLEKHRKKFEPNEKK